jgi:hypothetical protein
VAVRRADPAHGELGKRFVLQGGTQQNLAALKAQVDYIKSGCPAPRSTCTRTPARPAPSAQRWRRCASSSAGARAPSSASMQAIELSTPRPTTSRRAVTSVRTTVSRTFIDTKTPDGKTSRYISGFSCEKGTVESEEAMLKELNKERKA